jgi:hypothetical protein
MGLNVGYLKADTTASGDEMFTPDYAILPLLEYIPKDKIIWCPFDQEDSRYVQVLRESGYKVIHSHIFDGQDFFEYEPQEYDIIISNPPFSKKDKVLKRLYELNKPYAMLLPLPSVQGQKRFDYIKDCELLIFDKRINFYQNKELTIMQKGVSFASIYICKDFLPERLIFKKLDRNE